MKDKNEIKDTLNIFIENESNDGFIGRYYNKDDGKWYTFIFSWGLGWEHLSVSRPHSTPSWDVMCKMKDIFWKDDEVCVEFHPRKSDYVNIHEHCLHIWKPTEKELPTPPKICV